MNSFKVRCVGYNRDERYFTKGKVYELADGKITADNGYTYTKKTNDEVLSYLSSWYNFERVDEIKRVIFNDPATIIFWDDGTKTVAKCCDGDKYDAEKGFCIAYLKKTLGVEQFSEELHKWVKEEADTKKEKCHYYTGKVVCIKSDYSWWTVGKVYNVIDGIITANDGGRYPKEGERYVSVDDVRHAGAGIDLNGNLSWKHNYKNEFIPFMG